MLVHALLESAGRFPRKLAARDSSRELTYAQLLVVARLLRRLILSQTRCERVGLMLPGSAAGLGAIFGVLWAGKVVVPLNCLLQPAELQAIINDAGLDLVLSTRHLDALARQLQVRTLYLEDLNLKWRYIRERLSRTPAPPAAAPDDLAVILYTSGTTGQPKGVCLTHGNFDSNARAAIEHLRLTPDSHLLGIIPPFHVFGLNVLHFLPVILGATVTHIPRFSAQATYRVIAGGEVNIMLAVASMYAAVARLKELEKSAFKNMRLAVSGGEPLPRTVYDNFLRRTGVELLEGYGLTETSPVISCNVPWAHRIGTVGRTIPGVQVQLRDENGNVLYPAHGAAPVKPGGASDEQQRPTPMPEGELFIRGPMVMRGYYRRPEETAAAIDAQRWLGTGDIARIDADGYLSITGRAKDLIIVGGDNVFPREVERVLEQHPAVAEAAVIGQADASRGEVVVAFVVLHADASATSEEIRAFCRQHLAGYKTPREVHIRNELPRGPTGKVAKKQLKALLPAPFAGMPQS